MTVLKVLDKHQEILQTFKFLGRLLAYPEEVYSDLQHFICSLYCRPEYRHVNKLCYGICREKFQTMQDLPLPSEEGTELSLLPHCHSSLTVHTKQAHFQSLIWKDSVDVKPDIPSPEGNGRVSCTNGEEMEIKWTDSHHIP